MSSSIHKVIVAIFTGFFVVACGGGGGGSASNQAPAFTALTFNVMENQTEVTSAVATDADGDKLSFDIVGGADAAAFTLDATSGAASFITTPDFENPADANADNSYEVEVQVSDGETTVKKMVMVSVVNVNNIQVAITYPSPANDLQAHNPQLFVFGRLTDLEDGVVEADDINFLDVNGTLITPDPADPSHWSTRIDAPIGASTLEVTVESSSGQQHTVSQELRNQFQFVEPGPVALDTANNRAYVLDNGLNAIVEVDLTTGTRKLLSSANSTTQVGTGPSLATGSGISLDSANNRLLVSTEGVSENDIRIFINGHFLAVDLATGNRSYLSSASEGVGSGNGNVGTDVAMDIIPDPLNNRLLGLAYDGSTYNFSTCPAGICLLTSQRDILAIDGTSGDRSIFAGNISSDAIKLAMDDTNNRVFVLNGGSTREINVVDLTTGVETLLSGPASPGRVTNTPTDLAINADGSKAYVTDLMAAFLPSSGTNRASIIEVDGVSGAQTILSSIDDGAGINLEQPAGIAIDDANDRAIVTDKGLPAVLGVSLSSGDRSVLSGSVPQINYPSAVLADPANQRVFVGTGLQDTIFAVNLQTGALDVVSDATNTGQPILSQVEGMGLDATNNLLYFVDSGALQKVDLATGDRTLISGYDSGTGLDVGSGPVLIIVMAMALDTINNRAYVLDQYPQGEAKLLSIDLDTGLRAIVSDNVSVGTGQAFILPGDMAVDLANQKAYVGDAGDNSTGGGFVMQVDLVSGDRTVIANNTGIGTGLGTLTFISGESLAYDTVKQRLIYSGGPAAIDIATGDRESIVNNSGLSPSQLGPQFAGGIEDIDYDPNNDRIYIAERNYSGVFEMELTIAARGVIAQ